MDIGTGLTILGSALGGKDIIIKLLGPTAEYLGDGLKGYAQKRVENVQRILKAAADKVGGDNLDDKVGVPPKVLQQILNEGSFCDDELTINYFGGVLASSKTKVHRDDRGAYFNALIARLSVYQLRFHYILYTLFKRLYAGEQVNVTMKSDLQRHGVFIPWDEYQLCMDFSDDEDVDAIMGHILNGSVRENLIATNYRVGPLSSFIRHPQIKTPGVLCKPTDLGIELYLWANGLGQIHTHYFLDNETQIKLVEGIDLSNCAAQAIVS